MPKAGDGVTTTDRATTARTVHFHTVCAYVDRVLGGVEGNPPLLGSIEWQRLNDRDPLKVAAVYQAAMERALYYEATQIALGEASKAIAAAADWPAVAQSARRHADAVDSGTYIPRERDTAA